jgi:hypothetical protein
MKETSGVRTRRRETMRSTHLGVVLALALSFVLALAVLPAEAGKPDKPGKPAPSGPDGGTTCAALSDDNHFRMEATGDFTIELGPGTDNGNVACIDVSPQFEGPWSVTWSINEGETIRSLGLVPRDSFSPGDSCGGLLFRKNLPSEPIRLPPDPVLYPTSPYGDSIPLPYVNACGTDFAELVDGVSYDYPDEEVASPLVLYVGVSGSKGLRVTLHVDLPPAN